MIHLLALTASPESAPPTLRETLEAVKKGLSWFFTNLSPAFVWAIFGIVICGAFFRFSL